MRRIAAVAALMVAVATAHAQGAREWERYVEELSQWEDMGEEAYAEAYDLMEQLSQQKADINAAGRNDLESLPFLTARQVEDICAYLYRHGPVRSMGELSMVESLDRRRVDLLSCFFHAGQGSTGGSLPGLGEMLRRGRHELTATARIPAYTRKGDTAGYTGYQYKHSIRYSFSYSDRVKAGIVAAQDAGEPFFAGGNKWGYDYYSLYIQAKGAGALSNIVVGRYKARAGMGLVLNSFFSMGKMAQMSNLSRNSSAVRPHTSQSEAGYFQGAAATINAGRNVEITAFLSARGVDGTPADSSSISAISKSGYHRTAAEMSRKGNTLMLSAGAHAGWHLGCFKAGATVMGDHLGKELRPDTGRIYNMHSPSERNFWNASADYSYTGRGISVAGEVATGSSGGWAAVNSLSARLSGSLNMSAIHRFYSYKYHSLHAKAFGAGTSVRNESGLYLGAEWRPLAWMVVNAYGDYAYFPMPRYRVSAASREWDAAVQASAERGGVRLSAKYRFRNRQKDNAQNTGLDVYNEHRGSLSVSYKIGSVEMKTQAHTAADTSDKGVGWAVSQDASAEIGMATAYLHTAYFDTPSYGSRVYSYERGPMYNFSIPAMHGKGLRAAAMAKWSLGGNLTLTAKAGVWKYIGRETIGSGLQEIKGSVQTDIDLQARWKF